MTKELVDVVIVNWNSGKQLQNCISSLDQYGDGLINDIVVVDNNSTDNSINDICKSIDVKIINARENLGFGKACNLGAKNLDAEFLLFLNPDALIYQDTISKSLRYMKDPKNSYVGICGVQLIDGFGRIARSCSRYPTAMHFLSHAIGVDRIFPACGHFMEDWDHDDTRQVEHVIGAYFFVRRKLFDQLRGFDEKFFLYLEDLDFSLRAHEFGWISVYLSEAQAFHAGGGVSNQIKARRLFYSLRSRIIYSFKHFNLLKALMVLLITLVLEPISRTIYGVIRFSYLTVVETWHAYWMLWCWIPTWIFKGFLR